MNWINILFVVGCAAMTPGGFPQGKKTTEQVVREGSFELGISANRALDFFTPEGERAWVRGQHERTVNRDLALLRRMINLTIEEKKLQLACAKFPMVNEGDNVRTGFVEPAKFAELLEAMPEVPQPYLLFYYETGCRPKAARAIIWDWVKLDEGMTYIPLNTTKNDEYLSVPLSSRLVKLLRKRFHSGSVFVTTNFTTFRKAFRAACVRVGLGRKTGSKEWQYEGLLPYDLRRSAIRNLQRAGVQETVAMKISGHKTRAVFDRYNITDVEDGSRR